jgi:hypothetical protein
VRSSEPVEIGIDGEARIVEPPLRFVSRPRALTVRLPRTALRRSPAARAVRLIAKPTVGRAVAYGPRPPGDVPMIMERVLGRLGRLDRSAYQSVAAMSTPLLDRPLRQISDFADFSKPWLLVAAALALFGGTRGRRAPGTGIVAIGLSSLSVN